MGHAHAHRGSTHVLACTQTTTTHAVLSILVRALLYKHNGNLGAAFLKGQDQRGVPDLHLQILGGMD